jgi:1-hydroxycarotenoid 3,4-desaturase
VAHAKGFPLLRHTVFFSSNYAAEFDDLQRRGQAPRNPTVYVCAQDREDQPTKLAAPERLLCLTNAPARGDTRTSDPLEMEQCTERMFAKVSQCGLTLDPMPGKMVMTTPQDFNRLFPATGGALYGQASHGWQASFQRTGTRSAIPGLYFAGGSIHPGPGVPMAALSGQMAATLLMQDLASTSMSRRPATHGGTSMR